MVRRASVWLWWGPSRKRKILLAMGISKHFKGGGGCEKGRGFNNRRKGTEGIYLVDSILGQGREVGKDENVMGNGQLTELAEVVITVTTGE